MYPAKTFMNDLKKIYRASSKEIAENYLLELMERKISFGHKIVAKQLGKFILSILVLLGGSTNSIEEENLLKPKVHLPACTSWYIVL